MQARVPAATRKSPSMMQNRNSFISRRTFIVGSLAAPVILGGCTTVQERSASGSPQPIATPQPSPVDPDLASRYAAFEDGDMSFLQFLLSE